MAEKYSPRYMTEQEIEKIWQELKPRHRLVFQIMYYTGLRLSEVLRIQKAHINKENDSLIVPRQKNKKILNELIMIPAPLKEKLYSYLVCFEQEIKNNNDYIFYSKKNLGHHISLSGISALFWRARKQAGLCENTVYKVSKNMKNWHRITPHTHKNASIMRIYSLTKDLRAAQCQGHHSNIQSTMRYLGNPLTDMDLKKELAEKWNK